MRIRWGALAVPVVMVASMLSVALVPVALAPTPAVGAEHAAQQKPGSGADKAARRLRIKVISNRPDLVSAGDVLIEIKVPRKVKAGRIKVRVGHRNVTRLFALRSNGRFMGRVTGLEVGRNLVRARVAARKGKPARKGRVVITNHPNGGPVFAGPQSAHYVCQPGARDRQCNQPARYSFLYKSSNPLKSGLQAYDPARPPRDVATTTTDRGVTVPFVVRQETGYQARDQYTILTLFRPGERWRPWAPQRQWNHKVVITHGGSCGASLTPGEAPLADLSGTLPSLPGIATTYEVALGHGFAVLSTALDNTGHNCNTVTAAESLVMAKERLIEQYGEIRYTIGVGCSGGSIAEQTVANAYPGVYQGLVTACTYPDALSTAAQFADLQLLRGYFEDPSRWALGVLWLPTQFGQVEGHLTHLNAITTDELFFKAAVNPSQACPGSRPTVPGDPSTLYAADNPRGVRCSVPEMMRNALGPRAKADWSPQEHAAGHGFTGLPVGNEGIMYGLESLERGEITPAQFVDLNAKIGGLDIDGKPTAARLPGDRGAVRNAFRTGLINEYQNVSDVPIINMGGPDPGLAHDYAHAYWVEDRLQRSQGHTDNRVMWFGLTPLIGDLTWSVEGFEAMDRWLGAVEKDHRKVPLATKVAQRRPADVTDRCANVPGIELLSGPNGPLCQLPLVQTHFSSPREVAGGQVTNDQNICVLKPLVRSDIDATLTEPQWLALQEVFPTGVCDWSRPGVGAEQRNQTWLTFGTATRPVYGGTNLPKRPARSMTGWTSSTFNPMLSR